MRDGERKREIRDRENNLFERIWDVAKGEKPDFWKKWVKGHSENGKTNINHCSLRFCHESIPRLFCFRTTLLKIQVPVSRAQLFTLAHHPLPSSRESWAPSFQAQSWLRPAGQSIRKIQETSSRRMNDRSWTNRNNRCSIYQVYSSFFFFFKLYKIVLVLPNIKMNPPQVETAKETLMYRTVLWGTHVYSSF